MKELTIQYAGGSGGFLLLHLVLLSGKYQCKFRSDQDFGKFFKDQWNITDHARWKMGEVWPDNHLTEQSSLENKLYFICNPDASYWPFDARGARLVLYTDLRSQFLMSRYKNADMYAQTKAWSYDLDLQRQWRRHYETIKDPSWPKCLSTRKFFDLPQHIRKELYKHQGTQDLVRFRNYDEWLFANYAAWYKGHVVDFRMLPHLQAADYLITLQDLVNSPSSTLDSLGLGDLNQAQKDLLQHWRSLHPACLLERIGISSQ